MSDTTCTQCLATMAKGDRERLLADMYNEAHGRLAYRIRRTAADKASRAMRKARAVAMSKDLIDRMSAGGGA